MARTKQQIKAALEGSTIDNAAQAVTPKGWESVETATPQQAVEPTAQAVEPTAQATAQPTAQATAQANVASMASVASNKVVTGIPYDGSLHLTGASFPYRGKRALLFSLMAEGQAVGEYVRAANAACGGGIADVRIAVGHGLVVVRDKSGNQVYPALPPVATV